MVTIYYKIFEKIEKNGQIEYKKLEESEYENNSVFPFRLLDEKIKDMKKNNKIEDSIELSPSEAFGDISKDKIVEKPIEEFENSSVPKINDILLIKDNSNNMGLARVIQVGEKVTLDFNHPYAGKTVKFEIKILTP